MSVQCPSFLTTDENVFISEEYEIASDAVSANEGAYRTDAMDAFCGNQVLYRPNIVYVQREGSDTPNVIPVTTYKWVGYAYIELMKVETRRGNISRNMKKL